MLTLYALTGEIEPLSDYKGLEINRKLNGEYVLSLLLPKTQRNQAEYELVENEYAIEDAQYAENGTVYVDEVADEDMDLLAEVELGVRKPLWR